jgi:GMP synthase-like glutamine amidotransferase
MTRVLAVNNYPSTERFDKLRSCLERNGATVAVTDRNGCSASYFNGFDGVALSGSPDMLSTPRAQARYAAEIDSIRGTKVPLLGVCFGHQLMAIAFGSKVVRDARRVHEFVRTDLLTDDPLFVGLPRSTVMLESRGEVIEFLPRGFVQIARSTTSAVAAMKHTRLPLYGLQFHPERYTAEHPDGNILVRNFVRMLS